MSHIMETALLILYATSLVSATADITAPATIEAGKPTTVYFQSSILFSKTSI